MTAITLPTDDWWKIGGLGILGIIVMMTSFVIPVPLGVRISAQEGDGDDTNGEARCDILGSNCVCSEPYEMTAYTYNLDNGNSARHNPNDSASKECGLRRQGFPYYSGKVTWGVSTIPSALDAGSLPNGSIVRFSGRAGSVEPTGTPWTGGSMYHGHDWIFSDSGTETSFRRRSLRMYTYYNDDWYFCTGGSQNAKTWESVIESYWTFNGGLSTPSFAPGTGDGQPFGWVNLHSSPGGQTQFSSPSRGSIGGNFAGTAYGDGSDQTGPLLGDFVQDVRDKWLRYEIIIDNAGQSDSGFRIRVFVKNITDGGPEMLMIDSYSSGDEYTGTKFCEGCNLTASWNGGDLTDLRNASEAVADKLQFNYFTQGDPGCVNTWRGNSHLMVAAWSDDDMAGYDTFGADVDNRTAFRIGAASKMEGYTGINATD